MVRRALRVLGRAAIDFRKNQGFLLAGGVAYNALLSIVPLCVVLLVVLSHFVDQHRLLHAVGDSLRLVIPGRERAITDQVAAFLDNRGVVGGIGGVVLLFFSSIAFTVLENAMSVIFFHRVVVDRRKFLVSAVIPYLFILALGLALLIVTIAGGALEVLGGDVLHVLGYAVPLAGIKGFLFYLAGVVGLVFLMTAIYLVLPVTRVSFRHALIGGATATALWEIVRRVLVWYFANLSMVNVVYGSLATTIVVLLTLEAGALILLFGAQVIAEVHGPKVPHGDPGQADFR